MNWGWFNIEAQADSNIEAASQMDAESLAVKYINPLFIIFIKMFRKSATTVDRFPSIWFLIPVLIGVCDFFHVWIK